MQALLDVIIPVFLVIGAGYAAVWRNVVSAQTIDGIMQYTQTVAIPVLLFQAIWTLDPDLPIDPALLLSFYAGSSFGFFAGLLAGRFLFHRDWEDAVAIGFCCLFANSVMMGLAVTERAYGADALEANFVIIAMHSPFCYGLGITAMEIARARGKPARDVPMTVLRAMFRNALVIGIGLGLAANLSGLSLPKPATDAIDMIVMTALPAALFGMGGVLYRYRPQGDGRIIAFICAITLVAHPAITYGLGTLTALSKEAFRSAVLTAAMAPGINTYIFANMYGRARRVAASSVLIATALSVLTAWGWLSALP